MNFEYEGLLLVPIIIGMSEMLKHCGLNKKLIPIANMVMGLTAGVIFLNPLDMRLGILQGIVMALTASGLYSSVKNTVETIQEEVM